MIELNEHELNIKIQLNSKRELAIEFRISLRHFFFSAIFIFCWFDFLWKIRFSPGNISLRRNWMSTCWFPKGKINLLANSIDSHIDLICESNQEIFHFPQADCEKSTTNDQLYNSSTNTTTSSTDLSDFISNSNTSTSGNTTTTNTNSSSNNSSNNSNQLNGQDSSFPAGGEYKHFTSVGFFNRNSYTKTFDCWVHIRMERWKIIQILTVKSNC